MSLMFLNAHTDYKTVKPVKHAICNISDQEGTLQHNRWVHGGQIGLTRNILLPFFGGPKNVRKHVRLVAIKIGF